MPSFISSLALLLVAAGFSLLPLPAFSQAPARQGRELKKSIGLTMPKAGQPAPDFTLQTLEGKSVQAAALWAEKPVVLMTACLTCPVFRRQVAAFEKLAQDYAGRVHFLVVYTVEAHPQGDPSPYNGQEWITPANQKAGILHAQPATLEARRDLARATLKTTGLTVPMVIDTLGNQVWKDYGSAPNCACLIGKGGAVVLSQPWLEAAALRQALEQLPGLAANASAK